uniref:Uncharacterized protein n=1 Tax=Ceratitis capitata TaxID=7213 RepID=W8AMA1_CERCA
MLFTSTNTHTQNSLRLHYTTLSLTFILIALLISCIQQIDAADYDVEGGGGGSELGSTGDGGGGGGGGADSEVANGDDEIYETSVLQQDMDEHEKRKKLVEELEDDEKEHVNTPTVTAPPQPYEMSNESMNTIKAEARMDDIMMDSQEIEMMDSSTLMNGNAAKTPLALPPTVLPNSMSTMIPAYVRKGKAEQFPRTISGGSVSVEEADANVSTSDYVEDEEHINMRTPKQSDKIDPIAMKLYHHTDADAEDNMLNDQQPAPPAQQRQQQRNRQQGYDDAPVPQPRKQHLHPNSSDEDYYEDPQDSLEKQQLHQHKLMRPTGAPALPLTPIPPLAPVEPAAPKDNANAARRVQPAIAQARAGVAWTTNGPLMDVNVTPATATIPVYGENAIDAITPSSATTASSALAAGYDTESAAAAVATPTTTQTPTTTTTTTTTTTSIITTIRPANKQGKQINIPRGRKLLPHEQLRNYIEDAYIRMPLAVIVDPSADALEKTKALWREALRTNLNIKIVLVSLNASGVPAAYSFNNTRQFLAGLNSIKVKDGGNSFVGIVHASELVPYDSAVFISTAVIPPHTELVQDAAITLLKKRIRLYLIWYGERSASENETQEAVGGILGEVAIRSGGEVLHLVGSENSQELEGSTLTLVADAYVGTQEVDIPVDTTLSSLHVKIDAPMRMATLETPNGG